LLVQKGSSKNSKEAIYRFRALLYGDAVIIEKVGNTAGPQMLPQVLRAVLRRVLGDPTFPLPHLVNVGSRKLNNIIKSKGGVERVIAKLAVPKKPPKSKFAKLLSATRRGLKGADSIQVSWFSESGDLSEKDVDAVYSEFDDEDV